MDYKFIFYFDVVIALLTGILCGIKIMKLQYRNEVLKKEKEK